MANSKSQDIGLQDLLFNSAVACILLFIIFSIKVGGDTILKLYNDANKGSKYTGTTSLPIPNDSIDGKMQTVRMVELGGLNGDLISKFKEDPEIGKWDLAGFTNEDSVERQVYFHNDKVIYMLLTTNSTSPEISFTVDGSSIAFNKTVSIKARLLEGASMMQAEGSELASFNGYRESSESENVVLGRFELVFRVTDQLDELFEINII